MVGYRRNFILGGTFFFTVTLQDRQSTYLTHYIDHLRLAFQNVRKDRPFQIDAIIILPEHLHTIWTLPEKDTDYPGRWRALKSQFTRNIKKDGVVLKSNQRGEYNLWQSRYWEHTIQDETDLQRHIDYIHYNPVKHGLVNRVIDWPHSSFHQYVRKGVLSPKWSSKPTHTHNDQFGE